MSKFFNIFIKICQGTLIKNRTTKKETQRIRQKECDNKKCYTYTIVLY